MGHSGDSDEVMFVNSSNPPSNDKERLQVLKVTLDVIVEQMGCIHTHVISMFTQHFNYMYTIISQKL